MVEQEILQNMKELLNNENDYYKVLGVKQSDNNKDIKIAYRKLCMKYHPDKLISYSDEVQNLGQEVMALINKVYNTLSNEQYKCIYDKQGIDINNLGTVKKADIPENDKRIKELFKDILEFKDTKKPVPTIVRVEKIPMKIALYGGEIQLRFDSNDCKYIQPNELYVITINVPPFNSPIELDYADMCIKSVPLTKGQESKSLKVNLNLLLQMTNNSKVKLEDNDVHFKIANKNFDIDTTKSIKILGKSIALDTVTPEIVPEGILYKGLGVRNLVTGEHGDLILTR